jgi:uncharacterized FlaG/YvyC family protein
MSPVDLLGARPPLQASFQYDRVLRQTIVTLQNPETGGIVRQIPPEKIREMAAKLVLMAGQAFDATA